MIAHGARTVQRGLRQTVAPAGSRAIAQLEGGQRVTDEAQQGEREALAGLRGERVTAASSSLTDFAIAFAGGRGLLATAQRDGDAVLVRASVCPAAALPRLAEAVCAVDWGWIVDSTVRAVHLDGSQLRLDLDPAGALNVSAALWQDNPFLAFQPYRPASPAS
jgi:hypothetical protein